MSQFSLLSTAKASVPYLGTYAGLGPNLTCSIESPIANATPRLLLLIEWPRFRDST